MHCYTFDFNSLGVLPPYNNLWAQVIKRGDPPQIVTTGIQVSYSFPVSTHFVAEGIPLTEFSDSAPTTRDPYQLAILVAKNATSGAALAQLLVVAPVSTEMRCDRCHSDGQQEGIATGKVETNILTLHDQNNAEDYPPNHTIPLLQRQPVLCAECHSSNALTAPGISSLPSLSNAIHGKHAGIVPDTLDGCYNCHPGPTTNCLRDVMSSRHGMDCISCHGTMNRVSMNLNPW
ncbi:MAG: hypothetical protein PHQ40_21175 [Anaerolineaceae bacterium]|nr:hypothetical protein [Anaerolineaceae bacterium]